MTPSDVVMIIDPTVACPTTLQLTFVGNSSGVSVASSTLGNNFSVSVVGLVAGAYVVCVQPAGTGDFVQVPGVLTVKGALGFSPSLVPATSATSSAPSVLSITGFGLSSGDSVRLVPSGDACSTSSSSSAGVVLGTLIVSNTNLNIATVSLIALPPALYKVCLQQVGQSAADAVPGSVLTARGASETQYGSFSFFFFFCF